MLIIDFGMKGLHELVPKQQDQPLPFSLGTAALGIQ